MDLREAGSAGRHSASLQISLSVEGNKRKGKSFPSFCVAMLEVQVREE